MTCDRDAATRPEDARHHRRSRAPFRLRETSSTASTFTSRWPRRRRPDRTRRRSSHRPSTPTLSRLTDVIIPPTDTPGAAAAGVPEYIDRVVSLNAEHQPLIRAGLAWLERQAKARFSREFLSLERGRARRDPAAAQRRDRSPAARGAASGGFEPRRRARLVYYVAITDKDTPAPSAAPRVGARHDGCRPARPVFPPRQEPDGGRVLHVPRRPARGTWLHWQHGAREIPVLHHT